MLFYLAIIAVSCAIYRYRQLFLEIFKIYDSFKRVSDPNDEHGHLYTIWTMLRLLTNIVKSTYLIQHHDPTANPEKLNNKYLKMPFRYKDRSYFYLLHIPRGVIPIRSIATDDGEDVMEEIAPYLGPNLDCGNSGVTPGDFGYKKLIITTVLDRVAEFHENDAISLKN